MSRDKVPYVDHVWRHKPGGTDPLPIEGAMDQAIPYNEAFWNENTNPLDLADLSGAMMGHLMGDAVPDPPFDIVGNYAGVALLQGGEGTPHIQGQLIVGNASGVVIDAAQMSAITMLAVKPTWTSDPVGTGPYLYLQTKVGGGMIRQWSADPVNPPSYAIGAYVDFNDAGHGLLTLRMEDDGTLVTATNPVVWEVDDEVNVFWSTFTRSWD